MTQGFKVYELTEMHRERRGERVLGWSGVILTEVEHFYSDFETREKALWFMEGLPKGRYVILEVFEYA